MCLIVIEKKQDFQIAEEVVEKARNLFCNYKTAAKVGQIFQKMLKNIEKILVFTMIIMNFQKKKHQVARTNLRFKSDFFGHFFP